MADEVVEDVAGVGVMLAVDPGHLAPIEVAGGDREGAKEVAGARLGELTGQFEANDDIEECLDGAAAREMQTRERDRQGTARFAGAAGALADVAELLDFVGGVVVDAEAGVFACGEAAGMTGVSLR